MHNGPLTHGLWGIKSYPARDANHDTDLDGKSVSFTYRFAASHCYPDLFPHVHADFPAF
jgi:hypothetical protein